jgi:hypothetical protein
VGAALDYEVHILGVNATATAGPATIDGYFIYEFGNNHTAGKHINAYAGNVAAKVKVGSVGTAKANFLYVSGGKSNGFISINNETSAASAENGLGGSFGNMMILVRNSVYSTTDQFVIYGSDNQQQGMVGGSAGFDANLTDKAFLNVNAGFVAASHIITGVTPTNAEGNYQGTELNATLGYKMYDNLTASAEAAYVLLGDYYHRANSIGKDPANPYLARIALNYVF